MNLKIRQANIKDSKYIYELRNDLLSRKYSLNSKQIDYKEHLIWFKKKLNNKKNKIFIIYKDLSKKKKISYVRFDKNNLFTKVSIAIDRKFRKKGLSYNILNLAEQKLNKDVLLLAEVNKKYMPSLKLFKKLNYVAVERKNNFITFAKIFRKKNKANNYLKVIGEIENTRKGNNINWMDILRIAFSHSPKDTSNVFSRIFNSDKKINYLSKKLLMPNKE